MINLLETAQNFLMFVLVIITMLSIMFGFALFMTRDLRKK